MPLSWVINDPQKALQAGAHLDDDRLLQLFTGSEVAELFEDYILENAQDADPEKDYWTELSAGAREAYLIRAEGIAMDRLDDFIQKIKTCFKQPLSEKEVNYGLQMAAFEHIVLLLGNNLGNNKPSWFKDRKLPALNWNELSPVQRDTLLDMACCLYKSQGHWDNLLDTITQFWQTAQVKGNIHQ